MPKQTLSQFGQTIKAKHPEYADLPDEEVGRRVLVKFPQYNDMVDAAPEQQPGFFSSAASASGIPALLHLGTQVLRHPLDTAQTVAGFASDVGRAALHPGGDTASTSTNPITQTIRSMALSSAGEGKQAVAAAKQGSYAAAAAHAALALPIVGPTLQRAMDQSPDDPAKGYVGNLKNLVTNPGAMGTLTGATASLALPEISKALPATAGTVMRSVGDALQDTGATRMDRFLNGGKALPVGEYAAPGRAVLDSGASNSVVTNRPQLTQNIAAIRNDAGPDIAAAVNSSSARIPLPDLKDGVTSVLDPMRNTVIGPLGNPRMLGRLNEIQNSFGPALDYQGTTTPAAVWDGLKTMDRNLNWNKDSDALEVTANNAGKRIRANTSSILKTAVPDAVQPIQRYADLSDALDLSRDNQDLPAIKFNSFGRAIGDLAVGGATGFATHSPELAFGAATMNHLVPMAWKAPITQTGLATGTYQAGRLLTDAAGPITATAPAISSFVDGIGTTPQHLIAPFASNLSLPALSSPSNDRDNNPENTYTGPYQQRQHIAPPEGAPSVPPIPFPIIKPNPPAGTGQPIVVQAPDGIRQMQTQPWPAIAPPQPEVFKPISAVSPQPSQLPRRLSYSDVVKAA